MTKKKWIAYGVGGLVGLSVMATAAAAAADTMRLETTEGTVVPGGEVTERGGVIDGATVHLQQTNSSVTVVSAPSAVTVASVASADSPYSAPSADSAPSVASAPSAVSPQSVASAASAASVASAASD